MKNQARTVLALASLMALGQTAMAAGDECSQTIIGTDNLSYSVTQIEVPSSCQKFTIVLKNESKDNHAKYNVVVANQEDVDSIAKNGIYAGEKYGFVKLPDKAVIANSSLVSPGESASVTLNVSDIGPRTVYFSSFPGQHKVVKGVFLVK